MIENGSHRIWEVFRFDPKRLFWTSLLLSLALHFAHLICVPILITFDGHWYIRLADILGSSNFWTQWDFLRTPLFPALLKIFFFVFGHQALSVIMLQASLGFMGIFVLARTLFHLRGPLEASVSAVLLSGYPMLVTYEHAVLTEIGTFCVIALLLCAIVSCPTNELRRAGLIIIILTAGFYYRASILYLAPVAAVLFLLDTSHHGHHGATRFRWPLQLPTLRRKLWLAITIVAIPFLLAWPWQRNPKASSRTGESVLLYGLVKQAVIPPEDPMWRSVPMYREAIRHSLKNGRLPITGLSDGAEYAPLGAISNYGPVAESIFVHAIWRYPKAYLGGVERNLLLYVGGARDESDSAAFLAALLSGKDGAKIYSGPVGFPPLGGGFEQKTGTSLVRSGFAAIASPYDFLVFLGVVATVAMLVLGLLRIDVQALALASIPFAFLLLNAILLSSQDRMAFPVFPLLLVNLVVLPRWLCTRVPLGQSTADNLSTAAAQTESSTFAQPFRHGSMSQAEREWPQGPLKRQRPRSRRKGPVDKRK
jgi:hypothetical protein